MIQRMLLLCLCISLLLAVGTARAGTIEAPIAVRHIHRDVRAVNHDRSLLAYPAITYGWRAETTACGHGCEWRISRHWYDLRRAWDHRLARMRHPSISACWRFLARRFRYRNLAYARFVVNRESGCYWAAANPRSSARGVFQFLDTWGTLSQRLDAVWSINRAYRAVGTPGTGWSPWR